MSVNAHRSLLRNSIRTILSFDVAFLSGQVLIYSSGFEGMLDTAQRQQVGLDPARLVTCKHLILPGFFYFFCWSCRGAALHCYPQ